MKKQGNGLSTKAKVIVAVASGVVLAGAVAGILIATAHKHEYSPTVTDATCLEQGYTTYACECGEKYVDNYISAKGHINGEWIVDKEATCTEDGSKHQVCSVCETTIKTEKITKLGHTNGAWITDKVANCTEDGSKHQICSVCDATIKTETIAKLGHTDGEWITDNKATCTENGSKHQVCSVCNASIKTDVIAATGHIDGKWITDASATCTENGSKHQVCAVCDATIKTETITKFGHTDGQWVTDANATCTEDGRKHQACSVCNDTIKTEIVAAKGHNFTKAITDATSESNAVVKYSCSICEYSYTEEATPITVSASLTGSGLIISTGTYYTRSFEVTASGGVGQLQYKFEAGTNLLRDFSTDNEITVQGNAFIDLATIKITVTDEIGQKTIYEIRGDGSYVDSYIVYD